MVVVVYALDRDLSGGFCYPAFEQLGPWFLEDYSIIINNSSYRFILQEKMGREIWGLMSLCSVC